METETLALLGSEQCEQESMCLPGELFGVPPPTCHVAITGAEGRCLPSCLPIVAARADQLRPDGCEDDERCTPCYDPLTAASTGACDFGAGPSEPPILLEGCCDGIGRCVPDELLSDEQRAGFGRAECGESALCVPQPALVVGTDDVPAACASGWLSAP